MKVLFLDIDGVLNHADWLYAKHPIAVLDPPIPYNRRPLHDGLVGEPVRMIGYGDNTVVEPTSGYGRRRQAESPLISFDHDWVVVGTAEVNQCYGDSGGPVLMTIEGVEVIVGVNSWGENDDCDGINYNTRLDSFTAFLDPFLAGDEPGPDGSSPSSPDGGGGGGEDGVPAEDDGSVGGGCGCDLGRASAAGQWPGVLFFLAVAAMVAGAAGRRRRALLRRTRSS